MFDYDTWLSTPPDPPINVTEDRTYDEYDEWKDNVAMATNRRRRTEI